ncbi:MAG: hypothetical protein RL760_1382 [Candidatus Eisenbacteria bacterium]|jgi:hypothetical protein
MAVIEQVVTPRYAIYNGDSCEVLPTIPDGKVGLSVYSPPFAQPGGGALYHYSSSPRDLSNARTFDEFLTHYAFMVREILRATMPGRMTAVHCADVPTGNTGCDHLFDLPGEIIRLHESIGFRYAARYAIWKEPLAVRNRTLAKNLAHKTIVDDSADCSNAGADYLLLFRKPGENVVPIAHPNGLMEYAGEREIPAELHRYKGWKGKQTENRFSHWIWRQYASSFWDDIRLDNVLPFRDARDDQDEKHVHPLQLDVIERCVQLWTNPDEIVLTPFMGVGSEVYGAVRAGRRGIGCELKPSYFRQAVKNLADAARIADSGVRQQTLFASVGADAE